MVVVEVGVIDEDKFVAVVVVIAFRNVVRGGRSFAWKVGGASGGSSDRVLSVDPVKRKFSPAGVKRRQSINKLSKHHTKGSTEVSHTVVKRFNYLPFPSERQSVNPR